MWNLGLHFEGSRHDVKPSPSSVPNEPEGGLRGGLRNDLTCLRGFVPSGRHGGAGSVQRVSGMGVLPEDRVAAICVCADGGRQ